MCRQGPFGSGLGNLTTQCPAQHVNSVNTSQSNVKWHGLPKTKEIVSLSANIMARGEY